MSDVNFVLPGGYLADQFTLNKVVGEFMSGNRDETFNRYYQTSAGGLTNNGLRLTYFTSRKTFVSSQGTTVTASTGAGATPTLCRFGVYALDAGNNGTLLAACVNDVNLWATANTAYQRPWITPFQYTAQTRYAFAELIVTGAALPNLLASGINSAISNGLFPPRLAGLLSGQADLPATFTDASVSNSGTIPWATVDQ